MNIEDTIKQYDQLLFVLQGGGALGAYQVGVCEALLDRKCEPTWVIGTSIGGINGAIIAGNKPADRIPKLKQFWNTIAVHVPNIFPDFFNMFGGQAQNFQNMYISDWAAMMGVNGFFKPRMINPWLETHSTPDELSFYDTSELRKTLEEVIDFKILNSKKVRLTVSAVCVETGITTRFDNTKEELGPEHIMATGALPPGLPAVKINNEYFWDGGINSNTPFEVLMEEPTNDKLLCFIVNLFAFVEKVPETMSAVLKRKKDLEYISQHHTLLHYFCELQEYKRDLQQLYAELPDPGKFPGLQKRCTEQHPGTLNIVRFHYRDRPCDSWSKDFEFSAESLMERFKLGYEDVMLAFEEPSWLDLLPNELQLHNF
ncbi:MAG TPA: patatin-like phospholipase family protein [Gammaproteobacteria bacterium]|nr:patatin-like phospholipase family protein [Gammaproteobacteria bacterium]